MFIQSACATSIVRFLIACEHKCILLFLFRSYIPCVYQAEPFHPLCPEIHKGSSQNAAVDYQPRDVKEGSQLRAV